MKVIQFIYKNTIIAQQPATMFLNQVDEVKWLLAEAYDCYPDDIETRITSFETNPIHSNYDVNNKGIVNFNDSYPIEAKGIVMLNASDDEFLDAIQGKNVDTFIEKYLHFSF